MITYCNYFSLRPKEECIQSVSHAKSADLPSSDDRR